MEVIKVARGRTVKFSPKRGKLTKSQAKRAVEKVLYGKEGSRKAAPSKPKQAK